MCFVTRTLIFDPKGFQTNFNPVDSDHSLPYGLLEARFNVAALLLKGLCKICSEACLEQKCAQ